MGASVPGIELAARSERADPGAPIVLAAAATGITDHIDELRGDVDMIFGSAGIAPEMAGSPTLKLKLASFCNLFEEAARNTKDDNFGLWFGNRFQPRDLGLWGYAAVSSPTLGSALENLVGLFSHHQESTEMSYVRGSDGLMRLEYQIVAPEIMERRQDAELSLGMFLNVFRECCGTRWAPEEVHFEHPQPVDWREHEQAFSAPVYFSQPTNALLFRDDILALPMPGSDLRLMAMMQMCLKQLSSQPHSMSSVIAQVRNTIRTKLPDGYPALDVVAGELRLTSSAIQRELASEGLAYKDVVEKTRHDMAMMYLRQRQLQLSEIAFLLGYSELSAFSRAVRRWTGEAPRKVRAKLLGN